jgi:hypothetical protein
LAPLVLVVQVPREAVRQELIQFLILSLLKVADLVLALQAAVTSQAVQVDQVVGNQMVAREAQLIKAILVAQLDMDLQVTL